MVLQRSQGISKHGIHLVNSLIAGDAILIDGFFFYPIPLHWRWKMCMTITPNEDYRKTSNISRTLVGNKIVDNSDVVGASPVGAAPTTSSFST